MKQKITDEARINRILKETAHPSASRIRGILKKAAEKKGLSLKEAGYLVNINDPLLMGALFKTAGRIKHEIYGERLVFFAPLYVSDFCVNDCAYCSFHVRNAGLARKRLTPEEIREQTRHILAMGHKRVLVEFGEDARMAGIGYITRSIKAIYSTKTPKGSIRRINVNIAATTVEDYKKLKAAKIGTYQLFQETYHRKTYEGLHRGPKADYDRQITAHCRAFEAGIDDVGLGVLFGLYDWKFEVLALLMHAQYLDTKYHVGPHTISVPRFQPAPSVTYTPSYKVNDRDFLKLIAIIRIAVPYTGMIISTRESPAIRKQAFKIGISQASAGSCTTIGGYGKKVKQPQFIIQDERPLEEIVKDIIEDGFLPSFCTACYRLGRTGEVFMGISKPGEIHTFCRPNGILTFAEYLQDFTKGALYKKGQNLILRYLEQIDNAGLREKTREKLSQIKQGARDLYF